MQLNNRPLLIGITGNIGSGKSSFCNYLAANGLRIISAMFWQTNIWMIKTFKVLCRYSPDILTTSVRDKNVLTINRKLLADKVFISETETNYLNSLIHPLVLQDFQQIAEQSQEKVLCFEVSSF
jgi:dephospho-CoA kinase